MSNFENVAIPIFVLPDGREAIPLTAFAENPGLADFISLFSNYWTFDVYRLCYVGPPASRELQAE